MATPLKINGDKKKGLRSIELENPQEHFRHLLFYFFNMKKTVSEAHQELSETYPEVTLPMELCEFWYKNFNNKNFNIMDKELIDAEPGKINY